MLLGKGVVQLEIVQDNLSVISMPFCADPNDKHAYGPVAVKFLCEIIRKLKLLHDHEHIHEDIQLANMLVHHRLLIDLDYTAEIGSMYPSLLLNIG